MYKNRKGFTLVELLAVIVILAIILAIAVPSIAGIINSAKTGAFESDAKMIVTGIEYQVMNASIGNGSAPATGNILSNIDDYGADPANYSAACITSMDPVTICITSAANSKFGSNTATATKTTITTGACTCPA